MYTKIVEKVSRNILRSTEGSNMTQKETNARMNEIINIALTIKMYAEAAEVNLLKIAVDEFVKKYEEEK